MRASCQRWERCSVEDAERAMARWGLQGTGRDKVLRGRTRCDSLAGVTEEAEGKRGWMRGEHVEIGQ